MPVNPNWIHRHFFLSRKISFYRKLLWRWSSAFGASFQSAVKAIDPNLSERLGCLYRLLTVPANGYSTMDSNDYDGEITGSHYLLE